MSSKSPRPPPSRPLERIRKAAKEDFAMAQLAYGLCNAIHGEDSLSFFANYPSGLIDWRKAPPLLRADIRALIAWALKPGSVDLTGFYVLSREISETVVRLRGESLLGRKFQRRAARLARLRPPLKIPQVHWAGHCQVMPEELGKPLTEEIIARADAIFPGRVEILPFQKPYWNSRKPGVVSIMLAEDGYTIKSLKLVAAKPMRTSSRSFRSRVEGELIDFAETGTEGAIWMIHDRDRWGYEALTPISEGDQLTITDQLGKRLWRGTIRCDRTTGMVRYSFNPEFRQQAAMGYWIHWIQAGFKPDDWAKFFIRPDYDRLCGTLIRQKKPQVSRTSS